MMKDEMARISGSTRWSFASGGVGLGVFENAHYFVLIFYNQVLGLSGSLTGLALAVGLILDAVAAPSVGFLSDNWKSRLGRRHPFLYAAILPSLIFYFLLWHPPGLIESEFGLFTYLVVCNIGLRIGLTLFTVPAYAIVAEITSDYDERTRLVGYLTAAYSVFNNGMSMIMYAFWLVPTAEVTDGILNQGGYEEAGLIGAVLIGLSMTAFSFGLHRYIPRLREYRSESSLSPRAFVEQARDVFRDRSLRALGVAGIIYYAASGTYAVLWVYIYSFFWEFSSQDLSLLVVPMMLAGVALLPLVSRVTFGREKKGMAILMFMGAALVNATPILARLLGLFPENGSDTLFWIMMGAGFFETLLFLLLDSLLVSMTSDLTEQNELKTGRRNEGVILSTLSFLQKCAGALGTLLGGLIIDLIAFPENAIVGEVDPEVLFDLGIAYGPLILGLYFVACIFILGYRVSREVHSATLARLQEQSQPEGD